MTLVYDLVYLLAVSLGWPLALIRRWRRGPGSVSLGERLGDIRVRTGESPCVWLHGVSLGEINATRSLVAELRRRYPDLAIAISSTTQTGLARARTLYPDLIVFRFPLDFSFVLRRVFERIRPSIIVLMELEAWPNLLEVAADRHIPVVIANARITEGKSMRRFRWPIVRSVARRMFSRVTWVAAQNQTYARRFEQLGVPPDRISVTGSLKYDTADLADHMPGQDELAEQMGIDRRCPLLVCGSTGPGEEALLLAVYERICADGHDLQLALIPRKPERFDEVAELIASRGHACVRRSTGERSGAGENAATRPVFLGDTMGELRKFYALADIVFVGRSLVPMGGSDVIEAAALGKPVLVGPHVENFADPVRLLCEHEGCWQVQDAEELSGAIRDWLANAEQCKQMAERARRTIASQRGATGRTIDRMIELVQKQATPKADMG